MSSSPFIQLLNFLENTFIDHLPVPPPLDDGCWFTTLGYTLNQRHFPMSEGEFGSSRQYRRLRRWHDPYQSVTGSYWLRCLCCSDLTLILSVIIDRRVDNQQIPLFALLTHHLIPRVFWQVSKCSKPKIIWRRVHVSEWLKFILIKLAKLSKIQLLPGLDTVWPQIIFDKFCSSWTG